MNFNYQSPWLVSHLLLDGNENDGLEYDKQYMNCRGVFRTQSNIYEKAKSR